MPRRAHAARLVGTGQSEVLGIQVLDMGVFGGIILGCIAGWVFNKFGGKQFPIALSMFSGVRFPFLIMICISCFSVWPLAAMLGLPCRGSIASLAGMIQESGNIGLFLYGMLNKLLVPLGLHHLILHALPVLRCGRHARPGRYGYRRRLSDSRRRDGHGRSAVLREHLLQ